MNDDTAKRKRDEEKVRKEEALQKIRDKVWSVRQKPDKPGQTSKAWKIFGEVRDENDKYTGLVKCLTCDKVKIFPIGSAPSQLKPHQDCQGQAANGGNQELLTAEMREEFRDTCVDVMADDMRPSTLFSTKNFQNMVQGAINVGAKCGPVDAALLISDRTTIVRALEKKADAARMDAAADFQKAAKDGACGGTTDMWTDSNKQRHVMGITMHLIDHQRKLLNIVLSTTQFPFDSESGQNLASHLASEFARFNLDTKGIVFVTDGGANIVKALQILGIKRLWCMDHCLNIILKSTFTMKLVDLNLYGDAGDEMFQWVKLALTFISATRRPKSKALQDLKKPPPTASPSSRLFHSRLPCMESLLQNFDEVCRFLDECGQTEIKEGLDKEKIAATIKFLSPIEAKAKNYAANDLAECDLKWLSWLDKHISANPGDDPYLAKLKENARYQFAARHAIGLMKKCKEIVALFKRWGLNDLLDETLKQEIPTRWNSLLIMLLSFPRNFDQVNASLLAKGRGDMVLTIDEQTDILKLIDFLKPWKEESDKVSTDKNPSLHLVLLAAARLHELCEEDVLDSFKIKFLKQKCRKILDVKFIPDELHKIATCLWPDFKTLKVLKTSQERKEVYAAIQTRLEEMKETNDSSNSTSATPPAKRRKLDDGYDLWRCSSDEEEETDELEEYLRCKTGSCSAENILNWWKEREHQFPLLSKLARSVLCIPASSSSSERVFSLAGLILSARKANMTIDHLDDVIFYKKYKKYLEQRNS